MADWQEKEYWRNQTVRAAMLRIEDLLLQSTETEEDIEALTARVALAISFTALEGFTGIVKPEFDDEVTEIVEAAMLIISNHREEEPEVKSALMAEVAERCIKKAIAPHIVALNRHDMPLD